MNNKTKKRIEIIAYVALFFYCVGGTALLSFAKGTAQMVGGIMFGSVFIVLVVIVLVRIILDMAKAWR
jgi:hypothetical protein